MDAKAHLSAPSVSATPARFGASLVTRYVMLGVVLPLVGAFAYLIAVMPYAAGYGDHRFTLATWLRFAWGTETWQHGAVAPLIAGFLVWRQRKRLAESPVQPSGIGLALIIFSLLAYWVGYRGNFYYIGYAAIHLMIAGVVLWLWGWQGFRKVSFPWLFLSFTWPYLFLEDTIAFQLRYFMVGATAKLLSLCGIGTLQDGTALVSATTASRAQGALFSVHVDGPCSGMRSLFALMMIGALVSYFRQRSLWRRLVLFSASVPLAVLANMARIMTLIFASMAFGQEFAVGKGEGEASNFHIIVGFVCFLATVALGLLGLNKLLDRCFGVERPIPLWTED